MNALVVEDNELLRSNIAELLRADGWAVGEADCAERAFEVLGSDEWSLVFCDVKLSDKSHEEGYDVLRRFQRVQPRARIVLMTGHASAAGALDAVHSGAYDYLAKPFENDDVLRISGEVRRGIEKSARPGAAAGEFAPAVPVYTSDIDLVGVSSAFVEIMKLVGRVAKTPLPVLITGESGTGKEVVARAIHHRSPRAAGPFVAVNCGAIPAELIESELFGHVRGSFTGATADRRGLWQEADGGTVFLDEITETAAAFQVKLLRALQEGEIRRVGSNLTQRVDVRVIAATNREIEEEVRSGRFRQDLFYRLNAVTVHLPPLRERREDILPLARHFAERARAGVESQVSFSRDAVAVLQGYEWPGNIRELENAIVRAAVLCDEAVRPDDLPERIRNSRASDGGAAAPPPDDKAALPPDGDGGGLLSLAELESRHIARVLEQMNGNKQAAARVLGINRTTLQRILKRYDLEPRDADDPADGRHE